MSDIVVFDKSHAAKKFVVDAFREKCGAVHASMLSALAGTESEFVVFFIVPTEDGEMEMSTYHDDVPGMLEHVRGLVGDKQAKRGCAMFHVSAENQAQIESESIKRGWLKRNG